MCNLYSMTKGQAAIRALFGVIRDSVGNLPPMPGIFPDYPAPIVRNADGGRELTMARWGMPSSSQALFDATKKRATKLEAKGNQVDFKELLRMEPDKGTTNIRNVESKHWKPWLGVDRRCSRRRPGLPPLREHRQGRPRRPRAARCRIARGGNAAAQGRGYWGVSLFALQGRTGR